MSQKRRPALKKMACPNCHEVGSFKKILYGMPGDDFDFDKYAVGGCCISEDGLDPDISCSNCEWVGFWTLQGASAEGSLF